MNQRYRVEVHGRPVGGQDGWEVTWLDRPAGLARLARGERTLVAVVEGSGSQWFVTQAPQPHLDGGYTVFGQIESGQDVVNRIEQDDRILRVVVEAQGSREEAS